MRLTAKFRLNIKTLETLSLVEKAGRLGMRDTVVAITRDAVEHSPVLSGHNRRSIVAEVSGMGTVKKGSEAEPDRVVDDGKLQGAVYSTSGYGGWLEIGHLTRGRSFVGSRPYFMPAFWRHRGDLVGNIKKHFDRL